MTHEAAIDWLMEGDPSIRWQTMRDLLGRSKAEWEQERQRIVTEGWGSRYLDALAPDGSWPKGRWTETVWTLLVLMDLGFPADCEPVRTAAIKFLDEKLSHERTGAEGWLVKQVDLCHLGFWLRIGTYFGFEQERLQTLASMILDAQIADGGWNCRTRTKPKTSHSSFHTTFNVLEGLRQAAATGLVDASVMRATEASALEFMLAHRMYRSDKTGEIVNERFTHLTFPSHWHYTVLRGLDYIRLTPEIAEPRLEDPISLIARRRKPNGRWPAEHRIAGNEHFAMEKMGSDSRWNTLRALRVLAASGQ